MGIAYNLEIVKISLQLTHRCTMQFSTSQRTQLLWTAWAHPAEKTPKSLPHPAAVLKSMFLTYAQLDGGAAKAVGRMTDDALKREDYILGWRTKGSLQPGLVPAFSEVANTTLLFRTKTKYSSHVSLIIQILLGPAQLRLCSADCWLSWAIMLFWVPMNRQIQLPIKVIAFFRMDNLCQNLQNCSSDS